MNDSTIFQPEFFVFVGGEFIDRSPIGEIDDHSASGEIIDCVVKHRSSISQLEYFCFRYFRSLNGSAILAQERFVFAAREIIDSLTIGEIDDRWVSGEIDDCQANFLILPFSFYV